MNGAIIRQYLRFRNCEFKGSFSSSFAFFDGNAPSFVDADIDGLVDFSFAHVERTSVGFTNMRFGDRFSGDGFIGSIFFRKCKFDSELQIKSASAQSIQIENCSIKGPLVLSGTSSSSLVIESSELASTYTLGPAKADHISVRKTIFDCRTYLDFESINLDISGSRFLEGGHVDANCSKLDLTQLASGEPLRITGSNPLTKPIVISLSDADAGHMTFSNVDLSRCKLYGARDLGAVVLESNVVFPRSPGPFFAKRKCIADEYLLRIGWKNQSWKKKWDRLIDEENENPQIQNHTIVHARDASQVSAIYRDLRHSYEARKDWLGAADFYYGEMEMRRLDSGSPILDRSIIFLYWLLSGYGLRMWRALFWLSFIVTVGALIFFILDTENPSLFKGFLLAMRSVIPGLSSRAELSYLAQMNEIALAIIGPVLLTLTALAIRERTKR